MKKSALLWIAFMLGIFSLPEKGTNLLRKFSICAVAPTWEFIHRNQETASSINENSELENTILKQQFETFKNLALSGAYLRQELQRLSHLEAIADEPFFERREKYLSQILSRQCQAIPAKVVFREPMSWSSSFWVNVGKKDNRALGKQIVEKDSIVVVGKAIVGVVEEVGETRSRIRLITDGRLTPSVRIMRGGEQNRVLTMKLQELRRMLSLREDLGGSCELMKILEVFEQSLPIEKRDLFLVKGQLQGSTHPSLRIQSQKLHGVGFHYHFDDEEGQKIELSSEDHFPLIQKGDLLVTTGMDGIFPPDMHIAYVTKVFPLQEGECAYSLEALPVISHLDQLTEVSILPKNP